MIITAVAMAALTLRGFTVDFSRIRHWAGSGDSEAALVVQFADGKSSDAYVWGYRFDADATPTAEDMFRAVAAESGDLVLLTQYTGYMGNTVCGIGHSPASDDVLGALRYDFEAAVEDGSISFGYYTPNATMGQTSAPGGSAPDYCYDAIAAAEQSHIIEHPLNAATYGYACYDYDYWQLDDVATDDPAIHWNSGWYVGYWSYWVGGADSASLGYSAWGITSVPVSDQAVHAFKYLLLSEPDASTGASTQWGSLNYHHYLEPEPEPDPDAGIATLFVDAESRRKRIEYYRIDGTAVGSDAAALRPGVYLRRQGSQVTKILIN